MSMAVVLLSGASVLSPKGGSLGRDRLARWLLVGLCAAACYFSQSRGPWLAMAIGLAVVGWLGTHRQRRILVGFALCAALVLVLRPGVAETLSSRYQSTIDPDSFKAGTYKYRWELWRVAWTRISNSPWRLALGYGPSGSRRIDQEWDASFTAQARTVQIWSWDNEYALVLLNYGVVGLTATAWLYVVVMRQLVRRWRSSDGPAKEGLAAIIGAASILLFMKSNVLIFAPQLIMLFWLLTACGLRWCDLRTTVRSSGASQNAASAELVY